ncbi:hypothetical protein QYF61_027817 [Mycteria americana]|uniref:Uncharacterized protein n=1 Tax=Mycteria americana TaxID=33587 RepID=A0AAN7NFY4_MYCAM|nr:hypothetical protein QYF61_027813 [Mycteria americana]KAK4814843.1 hypothetical protein QYF61_027816 [Mycteria americana]KAK4814844.1 hypothetical protein QYF61_027817 [Mycteria americana]
MVVHTSHAVTSILEQKGGHWLSPSRFLKYQAVLMEQDKIEIVTSAVINPTSFLSNKQEMKTVVHDCIEIIETVYASRPDLKDEPLEEADHTWYTDGNSFVKNGVRMAGYAVTTHRSGTSAQRAEIVALVRALELAKGLQVNIRTDSKYAFGVVHAHGAIRKEELLEAVQLPSAVVIMHCKGHQKGNTDRETIVGTDKDETHWRTEEQIVARNLFQTVKSVVDRCETRLKNNPKVEYRVKFGSIGKGNVPGQNWQIDFLELPRKEGYRHLLVLTHTYSGWPEAFPCRTNKAQEVTIKPKKFGVPEVISSDRGPHFVSQALQQASKFLEINWKLHTAYRPQASGQVQKMIKTQLSKIFQETNLRWDQALPIALLRLQTKPRTKEKLSPFEILYGRPFQTRY